MKKGYLVVLLLLLGLVLVACDNNGEHIDDEPVIYQVTFNTNGGGPNFIKDVVDGEKVDKPSDPVKKDHIFKGWYKDAKFNSPWIFESNIVSESTVLFAKWEEDTIEIPVLDKFIVTFISDDIEIIPAIEVEEGKTVNEPTPPTKDGYIFIGWHLGNDLFDFDTAIFTNIELVALWQEEPTGTAPTIYLVGDSTVSPHNDAYYYPRYGYGTQIENYLVENTNVVNLALSGRSSKSFLVENNYKTLINNIKEGDFLIIGFGHNDQKNEDARYTNPNTGLEDNNSFQYHLYEYYIKLALENGATPILTTPIVRRNANNNYTGNSIHITSDQGANYPGGNYSQAVRDLANDKDILFIDLTELTKTLYMSLGAIQTSALHAMPTDKITGVDNTHLNEYGASYVAYILMDQLNSKLDSLSPYILPNIKAPNKEDFTPNPNYVPLEYDANFTPSEIFTNLPDGWFGSAFGSIGGQSKVSNFQLFENNNTFTLDVVGNSGKIAGSEDGLGFIFQQIEGNKDFEMSATMKLIRYESNSQIAFGLMVRDDIYIDLNEGGITSDYITAGIIDTTAPKYHWGRIDAVLSRENSPIQLSLEMTIDLSIKRVGNTYTITIGDFTKTIDANLTAVDSDYDYVGMYISRNAKIEFTNVELTFDYED